MSQSENAEMDQPGELDKIVTMVLLGKNSNDKSMVGNNLLKTERFTAGKDTITRIEERVGNQTMCIINTPDLFHEQNAKEETDEVEELKPEYPGERAFLLVLQDKQLSQEDTEMFGQLKERFGEKMVENTIVVLVSSEEKPCGEAYEQADENLKKLLDECGRKMFMHNRNEGMKDNELTKQFIENWKTIYEKQDQGASISTTVDDGLYEDIEPYVLMNTIPEEQTENSKEQTIQASEGEHEMTMVLLGTDSKSKCLIGNLIFNKVNFQSEKTTSSCEKIVDDVDGQKVCIINTPDLFHKPSSEDNSMEELKPSYTGFRVFLLVLKSKKVSPEEMDMFTELKTTFGERLVKNAIVLFEECSSNSMDKHISFNNQTYLILNECGNRKSAYHKNIENAELMKELKKHIESMKKKQTSTSDGTRSTNNNMAIMQSTDKSEQTVQTSEVKQNMTLVLLGNDCDNNSFIGNLIFNKECFQPEKITCEKIVDDVHGQKLCIINTPKFFHKPSSDEDIMEELKPSYIGPRVFLLIFKSKKVSREEMEMYTDLKKRLGESIVNNTIVLVEKKGYSTLKDNKASPNAMQRRPSFKANYYMILNECGHRKGSFNKNMKNAELIKELQKHTERILKQTSESDTVRRTHGKRVTTTAAPDMKMHELKPTTIVLLGQTGSGKSATGNTILKKHRFESHASSVPVTKECQVAEGVVFEKKIRVIDTPDFFNEDLENQEEQIKKCKELAQPGPDLYLLVMQLGRFTDGEREVLPHLKREFGDDVTSKMMILFTGKEKLKDRTLMDYINSSDIELQKLVKACESRFYTLDNNDKSHHQVKGLMKSFALMQGNVPVKNYNKKKHEDKDCSIL